MVGMPENGGANMPFGGRALSVSERRPHGHVVEAAIETVPHGIALAGGCCGGGYAQNGKHAFTSMAAESPVDLPYLQLLQCQKQ